MNGINILNRTELITVPRWYAITGLLLLILTLVFIIIARIKGSITWLTMGFVSFISCMVLMMMIGLVKIPSGMYRYEATIDESLSLVDIYEKYEIIEQRGNIWVLEDKEMEE